MEFEVSADQDSQVIVSYKDGRVILSLNGKVGPNIVSVSVEVDREKFVEAADQLKKV